MTRPSMLERWAIAFSQHTLLECSRLLDDAEDRHAEWLAELHYITTDTDIVTLRRVLRLLAYACDQYRTVSTIERPRAAQAGIAVVVRGLTKTHDGIAVLAVISALLAGIALQLSAFLTTANLVQVLTQTAAGHRQLTVELTAAACGIVAALIAAATAGRYVLKHARDQRYHHHAKLEGS